MTLHCFAMCSHGISAFNITIFSNFMVNVDPFFVHAQVTQINYARNLPNLSPSRISTSVIFMSEIGCAWCEGSGTSKCTFLAKKHARKSTRKMKNMTYAFYTSVRQGNNTWLMTYFSVPTNLSYSLHSSSTHSRTNLCDVIFVNTCLHYYAHILKKTKKKHFHSITLIQLWPKCRHNCLPAVIRISLLTKLEGPPTRFILSSHPRMALLTPPPFGRYKRKGSPSYSLQSQGRQMSPSCRTEQ